MMTREEILSIEEYCAEHKISHKKRLEELGIPFWHFYKAKQKYRRADEQSLNACTINSAYAMGVSDILGSITVGKKANLIITKPVPSLAFIPYSHQTPVIERVIISK